MSSDQDAVAIAQDYVTAVQRCRDAAAHAKKLSEHRAEIGDDLMAAMRADNLELIKLDSGHVVRLYEAKKKEVVNDEFIRDNLAAYFQSDAESLEAGAAERAAKATEFIFERRSVEEEERLGVKNPPKAKSKKPAAKKQKK